jgi:hypothetical protein
VRDLAIDGRDDQPRDVGEHDAVPDMRPDEQRKGPRSAGPSCLFGRDGSAPRGAARTDQQRRVSVRNSLIRVG